MTNFLPDVLLGSNQLIDGLNSPLPGLVVWYWDRDDFTGLGDADFNLLSHQVRLVPFNGIPQEGGFVFQGDTSLLKEDLPALLAVRGEPCPSFFVGNNHRQRHVPIPFPSTAVSVRRSRTCSC